MLFYIILVLLASSYFNVVTQPINAAETSYKLSCNRITRIAEAAYREKRIWTITPNSLLAIKESNNHQYAFKTPSNQLANKWVWNTTEDLRSVLFYSDSMWGINRQYIPQSHCMRKMVAQKVPPMEESQKLCFFIRSPDWVFQGSPKYKWPYIFLQSGFDSVIKGSAIAINIPSEMLLCDDSTNQYNVLRLIDELLQKTDACTTVIIMVSTPISENSVLVKSILDFLYDKEWTNIKRIVLVTNTLDMIPDELLNVPSYIQVDRQIPMFEMKRLLKCRILPYLSAHFNKEISMTEDSYKLLGQHQIYSTLYPYAARSLLLGLEDAAKAASFQNPDDANISIAPEHIITALRTRRDLGVQPPSYTFQTYSKKVSEEFLDYQNFVIEYRSSPSHNREQSDERYINGLAVTRGGGNYYKITIRRLTDEELAENEHETIQAGDIMIKYSKDMLLGEDTKESIKHALLCADYYRETHHPKAEFPLRQNSYILEILPMVPSILLGGSMTSGPSWGAALATLFISTFDDELHTEDVAVTGTINPTGFIGGIGYIHAKFLGALDGAKCDRIRILFCPHDNRQELINSTNEYFLNSLNIHTVLNIEQLIQILKKHSTNQL